MRTYPEPKVLKMVSKYELMRCADEELQDVIPTGLDHITTLGKLGKKWKAHTTRLAELIEVNNQIAAKFRWPLQQVSALSKHSQNRLPSEVSKGQSGQRDWCP